MNKLRSRRVSTPVQVAQPRPTRGLRRLLTACFAPPGVDEQLPTFATTEAPKALVGLPLLKVPERRYLPIPKNPLPPEIGAKLVAKITAQLDEAEATGLDARGVEGNLRKNVWGRVIGGTLPGGMMPGSSGAEKALATKLAKLNGDIEKAMGGFTSRARAEVPGMADRDIKRACTNIWPMLCLQALDGKSLRITNSMVGFSMLYPLTDDIIDEPSLSKAAKKDFLGRFARLISHGDAQPAPDDAREGDVWRMFRLIESDWPRAQYPLTYRAMGELLQAQIDSQVQLAGPLHGNKPVPDMAPVWEVTVRKGALSILCDAFLVKGHLRPAEASFAAHFGLMTQFLNDIRTVDGDLAEGQYTPFNLLSSQGENLDAMFDRVFNHFLVTFETPQHAAVHGDDPTKKAFMQVMLTFLSFKLIEGAAINQDKFSRAYLSHIETEASPMPLALIKRLFDVQYAADNHAASIMPNLEQASTAP